MKITRLYLDEALKVDMSKLSKIVDREAIEELNNIACQEEFDSIFKVHYPLGITSIPMFNDYSGETERVLYKNIG